MGEHLRSNLYIPQCIDYTESTEIGDSMNDMYCVEDHDGKCKGEIAYRMSLSPSGKSFPRCDFHWHRRLYRQEQINRRYPATAPSDFDPY